VPRAHRPGPHGRPLLVLGAILAAALNLRIAIAAIGPLTERIRADLDLSSTLAGVLNAIPFLCMGVFALLGPYVLARPSWRGTGRPASSPARCR
jgi:CP family cyanate transporter-like MFS transporter